MKYPSLAVLIPIWKEKEKLLNQNVEVFSNLRYPGKVQVYWLLHETDKETIKLAKKLAGKFRIIIDNGRPTLKANALNNAIERIRENVIVVFDVDAIPSENYFVEGVKALVTAPKDVRLVLGEERFYNSDFNWLTRCQDLEFKEWNFFRKNMVIKKSGGWVPIGGSGYFVRRKDLLEVNGWSIETVTEDTDLMARFLNQGKKMQYFEEPHFIEAVEGFSNFIKQRIRWQKGWLQLDKNWNLKNMNSVLSKTFLYLKYIPFWNLVSLMRYLILFWLALVGANLLALVCLLFIFLFADFEINHWEYQKRHGILPRKVTYSMIPYGIITISIPIFARIELLRKPLYWYHTKKWGIWNLKEFLKRLLK